MHEIQDDEGRILFQNGQYSYEFNYKDHLGNTRVSFKANGQNLEKTAETAFDPWGVRLNIGAVNAFQNRFKFLNRQKEATFGLNYYRLGARGYNGTNGRFDAVDPEIEGQEMYSTYQYSWNNPVLRSDPNGTNPCCGEYLKAVSDFAKGALAAIADDNTIVSLQGQQFVNSEKGGAYGNGVKFGHGLALMQAVGEVLTGAAGDAGAVALTPVSGGGSLALTVPSTTAIAHGLAVGTKAVVNMSSNSSNSGSRFSSKEKNKVLESNKEKNSGKTVCENCNVQTTKPEKSKKGVTPPKTDTQIDHIKPKSKGGQGKAENGQVLCRGCNRQKSDN